MTRRQRHVYFARLAIVRKPRMACRRTAPILHGLVETLPWKSTPSPSGLSCGLVVPGLASSTLGTGTSQEPPGFRALAGIDKGEYGPLDIDGSNALP